jgi:hypothetical protein
LEELVECVFEVDGALDFDKDFVEEDLERDVEECFVLDDFLELSLRLQRIVC